MGASALSLAAKGAGLVTGYLKTLLDPGLRKRLDEETTAYVLAEIPRIVRLLEERFDEVAASGCTPVEANIIAHQVIEAQKRTLDDEKRQRLTNVLVNGLCSPSWSKVKHRLLIRLTSELEEEHIDLLAWYASPKTAPAKTHSNEGDRRDEYSVSDALQSELIARGLLIETPTPTVTRQDSDELGYNGPVDDVELDWDIEVSPVGLALLAHLRPPEETRKGNES